MPGNKGNMRGKASLRRFVLILAGLLFAGGAGTDILAQAPTLQVVFPEDGQEAEGVLNLRAYADEAGIVDDIDSVVFFRNSAPGTRIKLSRVASGGEWSGTWNVSSLSNGAESVTFRAFDDDSPPESTTVQISVTIANGTGVSSPTIELTAPAPGSLLRGDTALTYTASGGSAAIDRTYLRLDGGAPVTLSGGTYTFNTTTLPNGTHTIQLTVVNFNGDSSSTQVIAYQVDNTPAVAMSRPMGGDTVGGRLTVEYVSTAWPPAVVASDSLYVDGEGRMPLTPGPANSVDIGHLADGTHTLRIKTTDGQGRVGWSESVAVQVRQAPRAAVNPSLADSTVFGTLVIRFQAEATAPASVASTEISVDGGQFAATDTDSSHSLDTRPLTDGAHTVRIRVRDNRGHVGMSQTVLFRVDNRPRVSLLVPAVDTLVRGMIEVSFTAEPVAPDSIASTEISVGGGDWISTDGPGAHSLDTREFQDGDLRIQIRATDASGKTGLSAVREFTVDNSAPKLSLPRVEYPQDAGSAKTGVNIRVTVQALDFLAGMDADSALLLVSDSLREDGLRLLLRDDGEEGDAVKGDNVFSSVVEVGSGATGSLAYSLRGRDALGNDTTLSGKVILDNTLPALTLAVEPEPEGGPSGLEGEVYASSVLIRGTFRDEGGSGMREVRLVVRNDSGTQVNNSPEGIPLEGGAFKRIVHLVPGLNILRLIGVDRAGNLDTAVARLDYVRPKATELVGTGGGSVTLANGSGVSIPGNALHEAVEVSIRLGDPGKEPKPLDDGMRLLGVPHEFGPDETVFRIPVTLTLAYSEAQLDTNQDGSADFDENALFIVFWNGKNWVHAGDVSRDTEANRISVQTNHFTMFDLAQSDAGAPDELVAYWNANPVRERSEFVYKAPEPGRVSLHILDMAGDLVRELIRPGTRVSGEGSVQWDGSNVSGGFAGAGLYIYVFRYQSSDGSIKELIRKPIGLVRR